MKEEMNELKVLGVTKILKKDFTMYGDINNPLFLAKEVAERIKHSNLTMMLKGVDDDELIKIRPKYSLGLLTNNNGYNFLTENGLYEVCMLSRKEEAKQMKKEVKKYLKQIRLTGGYIPVKEEDTPDIIMAKALKIADKTIQEKDAIIESLKPKAKAYDDLVETDGLLSLKEVADLVDIGRTKLCTFLRKNKILSKQTGYNEPMGRFVKSGHFDLVIKEAPNKKISVVTLVTPKGLNYIYKLIHKQNMENEFNTEKLVEVSANA